MSVLVNTLIIGAQKAGTTSLFRYLSQHPDVTHSTVKEPTYFIDDAVYSEGVEQFHAWFPKRVDTKIVSSGHTHMLVSRRAPDRVRQYNPDMKFIVMLRDPVERAWSAYNYAVANGWQDKSVDFATALKDGSGDISGDMDRTRHDTAYARNGLYGSHLTHWMKTFDKGRFHLIRSSDLRSDTNTVMADLFRFLEISTEVKVDASREYNQARDFRWKSFARFVYDRDSKFKTALGGLLPARGRALIRGKLLPLFSKANEVEVDKEAIPPDLAVELRELFSDDADLLREQFNFEC